MVSEDDLKLLLLPSQPSQCWDYRWHLWSCRSNSGLLACYTSNPPAESHPQPQKFLHDSTDLKCHLTFSMVPALVYLWCQSSCVLEIDNSREVNVSICQGQKKKLECCAEHHSLLSTQLKLRRHLQCGGRHNHQAGHPATDLDHCKRQSLKLICLANLFGKVG